MADFTLVDALAEAQNEIRQLKETILLQDTQYDDLQMEKKFHVIKIAELSDILQARGPDEMAESLKTKAIQNAELTVQVQELRIHLNASMEKNEQLDSDLKLATDTVSRLAEERKSHQKMLVELSDVVRALGKIAVGYEKAENNGPNWMAPGESLENIKRKVHAIGEDRQMRIEENDILRSEIEARDERIDALHRQALRLEAINDNCEKLAEGNSILKQECLARESKIEALEQLFITINNSRSGDGGPSSIPVNVTYEQKKWQPTEDNIEAEFKSRTDGSTEVVLTTTSVSNITEFADESDSSSDDGSSSSFSSLESPAHEEGKKNIRVQLSLLKDKYGALKTEHEETQRHVLDLENQLKESNKRVTISKKKQDLREGLLREVIHQYKELQSDHDEATETITELKDQLHDSHGPSPSSRGKNDEKKPSSLNKTGLQQDVEHIEENSTFDLSDEATEVSSINSTEQQEEEKDLIYVHSIECCDESMAGEFNRLKRECDILEHEYDNAIAKIANLEEELNNVQDERDTANQRQKESEQKLLESQHELNQLQHDFESAVDKSKTLEENLQTAKGETENALKTQKEREEDLLSVISQYKQVTEEKDEALSKVKGVERELWMAKKQTKRPDLIYDFKRLEQRYKDALENMERMTQQVKRAQTEATLSKEDAKSVRKRMAGCHFHYKHLQQQYNDTLADKAKLDREFTRAKNEVKRFKTQEDCWTEKIVGIREKRKQAEEENKKLKEQNVGLKSYCNNLLIVVAQAVPDDDPVYADTTLDRLLA
jgi:hypothetical protein